jgi:adenylate cyclase
VMLALGVLGLLLSASIAAYFQLSVIGRLNRLRNAVQGERSTEAAKPLLKGRDEIAEMARAVVNYVDEINRRDDELILSQSRLTNAIEAITDGFSLYDANDILITCNSRYRTLLYAGREDLVRPGQSFEAIIRKSAETGMIAQALADREGWIASRLQSHQDPKGPIVQQRSDGTWIEIQEHKTESADTVSVYTDVTERRQFIDRLLEAKQQAERASEESAEKNRMLEALSNKLSKYLDPQVYSSIFSGRHSVEVSSTRKKLTIFFSDIAGFTETTDNLESEELTALLNRYLNEMSKIALQYGATIDKFIGDAIMLFYGDPETRGAKEDALACVRMAIAMQSRMADLGAEWRSRGLEHPFQLRIGINTGFCTVGNFGSEDRVDYTIIGGEVNLAARLQAHAEVGGILIAHETYSLVKDHIRGVEQAPIAVKGFARPVRCYAVKGSHQEADTPESAVHYSGNAGTIALKLDRLDDEERLQLQKAVQTLLAMLDSQARLIESGGELDALPSGSS